MSKYLYSLMIGFAIFFCARACAAEMSSAKAVSMSLSGLEVTGDMPRQHIRFLADLQEACNPVSDGYLGEQIDRSLEFFLLGLCIPDEKFWVNLTPQEHSLSIDPELADTDLGKILLAADLTLKKDTSNFTNPRTSQAGRLYWQRLYAKASELGVEDMPIANRVWITPGAVNVIEDSASVRIVESNLVVCLEVDYMPGQNKSLTEKQRRLQEYSIGLMRELIIPALNKKVNESPAYENLRQAYRALILARWYRDKPGLVQGSLIQALSTDVRNEFPGRLPYSQAQIRREYMTSLRQGDYDFSENTAGKLSAYMELITRRYFSGGVDWRAIAFVSSKDFVSQQPGDKQGNILRFDIVLDSRQQQPVQYARRSVSLVSSQRLAKALERVPGLEENLPPVSPADIKIKSILNQDPAIHRIMSRNL